MEKVINPYTLIFVVEGIILPFVTFLLIRLERNMKNLPLGFYLLIYVVGVLIFPLLLPRKHIEFWMVMKNSSFPFVLTVVQMHNNIYEEVGKLLILLLGYFIFRESFKRIKNRLRTFFLIGLFAGISYGVGEALTLSLIAIKPGLSKFFGINLTLLFITWRWGLERFYAILLHGIMGSLVGLAIFLWRRDKKFSILCFILALLFHEFVDGTYIYMKYFMHTGLSKFIISHIYDVVLPLQILTGGGISSLAYFSLKRRYRNEES